MGRAHSLLLLAAAIAGCASRSGEPAKAAADRPPASAPASVSEVAGPVIEHLDAGQYVYLRIKTAKGEVWAAIPAARIDNGTEVRMVNPMPMTNFESTALKRTFDVVYFGTLAPAGSGAAATTADPHAGLQSAAKVEVGQVTKASGADARTVAEVWGQKGSLAGKAVTIRGVVVKYNGGVMGKNWIHLQDGSGDPKLGTNDIAVTSQDPAATGQTVTIKGTVATNRDFGAGYTYAVIIEGARVVKE